MSCGEVISCNANDNGGIDPPPSGEVDEIEIVTWNIEHFPKSDLTVEKTITIMDTLDADIYCIQEITDVTNFENVADALDGYNAIISTEAWSLGVIYRSTMLTASNIEEFFLDHSGFATRPPLKVDFSYQIDEAQYFFSVINLHMKCCGDGEIEHENENDEEFRRYGASITLKNYIDASMDNDNVIIVGDWNDLIVEEVESNNVFMNFIEDEDNFMFVDMSIANGSTANWSYPSWPSHIDHILITNELFDEFQYSLISTIRADDFIDNYFTDVSDHRPVMWKFQPNFE